jgi:hypothetical protein
MVVLLPRVGWNTVGGVVGGSAGMLAVREPSGLDEVRGVLATSSVVLSRL